MGQARPVKIIRLAARDTVDEIIIRRGLRKMELAAAVMGDGSAGVKYVFQKQTFKFILFVVYIFINQSNN
jgi:SNF2 family DNA or RNA helicase